MLQTQIWQTRYHVVEICDVAGMPELAGAMIRDGLTLDAAKSAILDAKAKAAEKAP